MVKYSFSDFIHNVLGHDEIETIKPLCTWFPDGFDYDYVLRFENLEQDIKFLQDKFDLPQLPHLNSTKRKHRDYREYYAPSTIKKVEEYYHEDMERFNYDY